MRSILSFVAATVLSAVAFAQQPAADPDHAAHHPDGASAPGAKKPAGKPKAQAARPKAPAAAASGGMGMGMGADMGKMHEQAHKPGGRHDQMHGKDGKGMGGPKPAMPAASASGQ